MALLPRLELRQSQSLVMTPQLMQAIKLLQLSSLDLIAYVENELERNPLLERASSNDENNSAEVFSDDKDLGDKNTTPEKAASFEAALSDDHPSRDSNALDDAPYMNEQNSLSANGGVNNTNHSLHDDRNPMDMEATLIQKQSLRESVQDQFHLLTSTAMERMIGDELIDSLDANGYLTAQLDNVAERLGCDIAMVETILGMIQSCEPSGVAARNLQECLTLQLKELNRFDPIMKICIDNLDLLAKGDHQALRRLCNIDDDDFADMIKEIQQLDPKPGRQYDDVHVQTLIPDVFVRPRNDGSWMIELNSEQLPKVLLNQSYYAMVTKGKVNEKEKAYLDSCLQDAHWLVRSLDQRAKTIIKVTQEIVRQQDAFLIYGVRYLKPLTLKAVADAIDMHESTVSRVTSNKYMATPRGTFELKYFFTPAIASANGGMAHSSESVRDRIKSMIDGEDPKKILSDDKIVAMLREDGVEIARRTVAKYREAMHIPSSVERRRQKKNSG